MLYVYIAGPYAGDAPHDYTGYVQIDRNILQAKAAFIELANAGIGAFCPHTHSEHFELFAPSVPSSYWHELDQHFITACDALLRLPGESKGADNEVEIAREMGKPVLFSVEEVIAWNKAETVAGSNLTTEIYSFASDPGISKRDAAKRLGIGGKALAKLLEKYEIAWVVDKQMQKRRQ